MGKINYEEMRKIFKTLANIFQEVGMKWDMTISEPYDGELKVNFQSGKDTFISRSFYQEMETVHFWKSLSQLIASAFVKQAPTGFMSSLWSSEEEGFFRVVFWIWTKNKNVISWYVYPTKEVIYIREENSEEKVAHTHKEYLQRLIFTLTLALEVYKHDSD